MEIKANLLLSPVSIFKSLLCAAMLLHACSENKKASPVTEKEFCASIHRNDSISLTKELENIDEEIVSYLSLENSMNSRNSFGGTSTKQTEIQIAYFKDWLLKA